MPINKGWQNGDGRLSFSWIDEEGLQDDSLPSLARRLGIGDRYLRQLFKNHLGISPKKYALY